MSLFTRSALAATLAACIATAHAAPVPGQGTWESTLFARDIAGHAVPLNDPIATFIWDATMNVTWLANMNQQNSTMNWAGAVAWAGALTTGGFTDWRLPTIIDSGAPGCDFSFDGGTDCGFNVQTQVGSAYSEWAHLYYVTLGNLAICAPGGGTPLSCEPQADAGLTNTAYFQDMQVGRYWSGTEFVSPASNYAWGIGVDSGGQIYLLSTSGFYAAALRSGDVLRDDGTVPEPQSLALALTALAGLGVGPSPASRSLTPRLRHASRLPWRNSVGWPVGLAHEAHGPCTAASSLLVSITIQKSSNTCGGPHAHDADQQRPGHRAQTDTR